MDRYGLIGKNIGYSFSRSFFSAKFTEEHIDASYENFDCDTLGQVEQYLSNKEIRGFNVTIPYKEVVIPLLDSLDEDVAAIGAVNTIKRLPDGKLKGFNTDHIGFTNSLLQSKQGASIKNALRESKISPQALVLGTGGASKAVVFALERLGFTCLYISRKRTQDTITYKDIDEELMSASWLIVNCTPLGTFPDVDQIPDIPVAYINGSHIAYDLIYNPSETLFLKEAKAQGATVFNGLSMLEGQAIAAWDIWQSQ